MKTTASKLTKAQHLMLVRASTRDGDGCPGGYSLATVACREWGHTYVLSHEPGQVTIIAHDCVRCGAKK